MRSLDLALALVLALAGPTTPPRAHAGSYGVSDGAISGTVLDEDGYPLEDVFVVAQRTEGTPAVIRSTRTDAQGRFYLPTPTGGYLLGFSRFGFQTLTTEQGEVEQRTALGAQVRAFVEPGQTALVQDITLLPTASQTSSPLHVTLSDSITGDLVPGATVIVGSSVTTGGSSGQYQLDVVPAIGEDGAPQPLPVIVQADGFQPFQSQTTVVGGGNAQSVSFPIQPRLTTLSGLIELDPTIPPEKVPEIQVLVDRVAPEFAQGQVREGGYFEVSVPASNSAMTRTFDLRFVLENASIAVLTGIQAPRGGSRSLGRAVRLESVKTGVSGSVVSSSGSVPNGGRVTQAVIVELGIAVPIQGGSFQLQGVPVGRPLTLRVSVEDPTTGRVEVGEVPFTATSGGSFVVPPIVTRPVAGR